VANRPAFVSSKIVGNDNIPWLQGEDQNLFPIEPEAFTIDGAINQPGCIYATMTQGCLGTSSIMPKAVRYLDDPAYWR
jgi:hypothetical protein